MVRGQTSSPSWAGEGAATLRVATSFLPNDPDPKSAIAWPNIQLCMQLFDRLVEAWPERTLVPSLAERWEISDDGLRYVFHLRPGVNFHDGHPLVAGDVKRSFLRVLNPQTHGGRVWPLLPIAGAGEFADGRAHDVRGIEVLGDTAVAFTLTEPLAIFPKFLAMPVASVVPSSVPADFGQRPVGTGAWRFVAWQHDDYLRFAKNSGYWGGAPLSESLTVRIIPEALTRAAEFLSGRISVVEIPFGETVRWEQEHPDWLKRKAALRAVYVPLNNRRGPLRDPRVRQAINHAVNVPEILRTVWNGRGALAAGAIPPTLGGSDPSRRPYAYDTTEARRLLRSAGYPNGFSVQLWRSGTNVEMGRVAQAIQSQLAAVGIRVEIVSRDASSMREAVRKGDTDMAITDWWADYPDADNFLYPLFHSASFGPGGNYAFYSDRVTDSLIVLARRTVDQSAREALYARIDHRIFEAAPWLYLWFAVDLWAEHPAITGWDVPAIFNGQHWTKVRVAARR